MKMIKEVGSATINKRHHQLPTTFSREKRRYLLKKMEKKGGITTHG